MKSIKVYVSYSAPGPSASLLPWIQFAGPTENWDSIYLNSDYYKCADVGVGWQMSLK